MAVFLGLCALLLVPAVPQRLSGLLFPNSEKHIAVLTFDFVGGSAENDAPCSRVDGFAHGYDVVVVANFSSSPCRI